MDFHAKFAEGLSYHDFLAQHGTEEQRRRWAAIHEAVNITDEQASLLGSFKRVMKVLCLSGAWCGDCVNQCPIFDRFARTSTAIELHFFDRDTHMDLAGELKICGGSRVPVLLFLAEDGAEVGRYGDRTLSRYRQIAVEHLGPACPTGLSNPDKPMLEAVTQEWLDEFERVQLLLRTSPRLRKIHND